MHKINQSFKPIIYKKKIKPKYCYLMGYCLKGRCLLKFVLWETRVLRDICVPEYHKYYSCPCFCFLTEVKSNWQS